MKISNGFFQVQGAKKLDSGAVRLKGHFIADAVLQVDDDDQPSGGTSGGSGGGKKPKGPKIELPKLEVKWILPPKGSEWYGRIKGFAEDMGYETVEHEDFSYPGGK